MEKLQNRQAPTRRRMSAARLVLAAALAAVCVLCMAAALPELAYHFLGSGSVSGNLASNGGHITLTLPDEEDIPIVLEDGRLWFVSGGERTDLTGLIDENTPYIHEHTDPASGITGYVIVGGTADDFGWAAYVDLGNGASIMGDNFCQNCVAFDGAYVPLSELTEEQLKQVDDMAGVDVYRPWYLAAAVQLGIEP